MSSPILRRQRLRSLTTTRANPLSPGRDLDSPAQTGYAHRLDGGSHAGTTRVQVLLLTLPGRQVERLDLLDLFPRPGRVLCRLQIVGRLEVEPELGGRAEEAAQPEGGVRADAAPARQDFMHPGHRHAQKL